MGSTTAAMENNMATFKTTLIGAAFGIFAFTFIGAWSLLIA